MQRLALCLQSPSPSKAAKNHSVLKYSRELWIDQDKEVPMDWQDLLMGRRARQQSQ